MHAAGEFGPWLTHVLDGLARPLGTDVACGDCNACCRAGYFVHVRPEDTAARARIPAELLFPAPGRPGHHVLGVAANGHCPMLKDGNCSIYEHRPQTCRDFDCRVFAATNIAAQVDDIDARARQWRFELNSPAERAAAQAVSEAGAFLEQHTERFSPDALPLHPPQLAVTALRIHTLFLQDAAAPPGTAGEESVKGRIAAIEEMLAGGT